MKRALGPLVLACLAGCSSPRDQGAPTSTGADKPAPAPASPAVASEDSPPAKPAAQAPKPERDEALELHRKLIKLLNEGRELTKKGDYVGGIAKYREALDIDASDPAVLGELGWAAYKSGELELAHRTTLNALKFVREDKQRGMMLYNLGRIEEDRHKPALAVEHYHDSLLARPGNKTVQQRLDALLAANSPDAPPAQPAAAADQPLPYTPLPVLARDLPDVAAVCKQLTQDRCADFGMDTDDACSCSDTLDHTPGADTSWGLLVFGSEDFPSQRAWYPVVQTDKGWTVFEYVLYEYNPGAFGIYEEATIGAVTVEPLLAKGTQLVMRLNKSRMDRDMGLNEIEDEVHESVVICARHEGGAACTRPLYQKYRYRREVEFEDFEEEGGPEIEHDPELPIENGFTATLGLGAQLSVTWTETLGGYDKAGQSWESNSWVLAAGEYALATLLGLPSTP